MNSYKLAVIILTIIVGLNIVYLFWGDLSLNSKSENKSENNSAEKGLIEIKNQFLPNQTQNNWSVHGDTEEFRTSQNLSFFNSSEIKSQVNDFVDSVWIFGQNDKKIDNSANSLSLTGDYYKAFLDIAVKTNFTDEEFGQLKKDQNNRVVLLEELMEIAKEGTALNELKTSFAAWYELDKRMLASLNNLSSDYKILPAHKLMVDWFEYHADVAKKLSEENLSQVQINQLFEQFQKEAEVHNARFATSLVGLEKSTDFVLINKAKAFTCLSIIPLGSYNFAGRVIVNDPCNIGPVIAITPPCGGLLLFSYPMLDINPFLWKNITPGSVVLGKSIISPGACFGLLHVVPYEAIVLYFGTN